MDSGLPGEDGMEDNDGENHKIAAAGKPGKKGLSIGKISLGIGKLGRGGGDVLSKMGKGMGEMGKGVASKVAGGGNGVLKGVAGVGRVGKGVAEGSGEILSKVGGILTSKPGQHQQSAAESPVGDRTKDAFSRLQGGSGPDAPYEVETLDFLEGKDDANWNRGETGIEVKDAGEEERKQTLTTLEEEVLIASLVDSEELGPAVRAVYERGVEKHFASALQRYAAEKDEEIRQACGQENALDFIRSVDAIVTVRDELKRLDGVSDGINARLQTTGKKYSEAAHRMLEMQKVQANLESAGSALEECIAVLALCGKAEKLMVQDKFLSALKVIKWIKGLDLSRLQAASFGRILTSEVPKMLIRVRTCALKEFNEFLASLRHASPKVGRMALEMTQERSYREESGKKQATKYAAVAKARDQLDLRALDINIASQGKGDSLPLHELGVDFGPLFRCLEVHRQLGEVPLFREHYRDCRRTQSKLDHTPPATELSRHLRSYLSRLLGFFALEDAICASTQGIIQRSQADSEWRDTSKALCKALAEEADGLKETELFLQLRSLTSLFVSSMDNIGYATATLQECLEAMWDRFLMILGNECAAKIQEIMADEPYEGLQIRNEDELTRYTEGTTLAAFVMGGGEAKAPCTMVFSKTVPLIIKTCRSFVFDATNFLGSSQSSPFASKFIMQGLERFLLHVVNTAMAQDIQKLGIFQSLQVSVNATALGQQVSLLMRYAGGFPLFDDGADSSPVPGDSNLEGMVRVCEDAFRSTRAQAEDVLFAECRRKVDEIMDIADEGWDWFPAKPDDTPSEYALDLVSWLRTTFTRFQALPPAISEALHYTTCKEISQRMQNMPLSSRVRKLNFEAFHKMSKDISLFEQFANDSGVDGLKECFRPNRQLCDLVMGDSLLSITDELQRYQRFGSLDITMVLHILERFLHSTSSFSLRGGSKRSKEVNEVLKKLKEAER